MNILGKILLIFLFVAMPSCAYADGVVAKSNSDDWSLLTDMYKIYLQHPSDDNAKNVSDFIMLSSNESRNSEKKHKSIQFIYSNKGVLIRNIEDGKISSVELAYSLLLIADGGFSEDLLVAVGKLSRISPYLFLNSLGSAIDKNVINSCEYITMLGQEYTDNDSARCFEKEKRIQSLMKVSAPELSAIKDRCLSVLQKSMDAYCPERSLNKK